MFEQGFEQKLHMLVEAFFSHAAVEDDMRDVRMFQEEWREIVWTDRVRLDIGVHAAVPRA